MGSVGEDGGTVFWCGVEWFPAEFFSWDAIAVVDAGDDTLCVFGSWCKRLVIHGGGIDDGDVHSVGVVDGSEAVVPSVWGGVVVFGPGFW